MSNFKAAIIFDQDKTVTLQGGPGVVIDGNTDSPVIDGVIIHQGNVTIDGITFLAIKETAIYRGSKPVGKTSKLTVRNTTIKHGHGTGIWCAKSSDADECFLEKNTLENNRVGGITISGGTATVLNNRVSATKPEFDGDLGQGIDCGNSSRCILRGNIAYHNAGVGIIGASHANFIELSDNYSYENAYRNWNEWPDWPPAGNFSNPPGSGGGTGGNPWGARSIAGKVVCSVNNQPVANVPIAAYVGTNSGPGNVIKSGKTAGNGQYNLSLDGQNERFTVRVMAGADSKDHDYAFKRSGNPGIACIDNNAFELCRYLDIPVGTTKAGFDFATAAQATNLRGSQQVGNLFVFQFNQAKDVRGGYLKNYVVRLDNKADGWFNSSSDYYVRVPKEGSSGVGTCSGGVCRITSSELNAIRPFKLGTYGMGVNPISNHQVSGQPIIELCRANATITAAITNAPPSTIQPCGNGWGTCRAATQGAVVGATKCYTGAQSTNNYSEWNCCPAGNVILNGRCAKVGKLTPN